MKFWSKYVHEDDKVVYLVISQFSTAAYQMGQGWFLQKRNNHGEFCSKGSNADENMSAGDSLFQHDAATMD